MMAVYIVSEAIVLATGSTPRTLTLLRALALSASSKQGLPVLYLMTSQCFVAGHCGGVSSLGCLIRLTEPTAS